MSTNLTVNEMIDWRNRMSQKIYLTRPQQRLMKRINKALAGYDKTKSDEN